MDKENQTAVFNCDVEINENGEINLPSEKLKELHSKGFKKVSIVFFGSSEKAVAEKNLDIDLYNRIKDLQRLPDTVILDFMTSKGVLKNSDIQKRIEF